jgi:hypothetical protein
MTYVFLMQKYCLEVVFLLIPFFDLYTIIFMCFLIAVRTYHTQKNSSFEIIHQKRRRVISNAEIQRCMRSCFLRKLFTELISDIVSDNYKVFI